MVSISILVPALISRAKLPWHGIPFGLGRIRLRILLFSLKTFALIAVAVVLDIRLVTYLPSVHFIASLRNISPDQSIVTIGILFAAVGWLLAPDAVAILRSRESSPTLAINLRHARIFAAVSILSSVAVFLLFRDVSSSFARLLTTAIGMHVFWAVTSVISALPYIPLFIALCLIANQDSLLALPLSIDPKPENLSDRS